MFLYEDVQSFKVTQHTHECSDVHTGVHQRLLQCHHLHPEGGVTVC